MKRIMDERLIYEILSVVEEIPCGRVASYGQIARLIGKTSEKGYALIPLMVYFKGSRVKVEVGLCRGKKLYDKREDMARKSQKRELERDFKQANIRV